MAVPVPKSATAVGQGKLLDTITQTSWGMVLYLSIANFFASSVTSKVCLDRNSSEFLISLKI